jgi:superoxide dismutase, Cu-Zn family
MKHYQFFRVILVLLALVFFGVMQAQDAQSAASQSATATIQDAAGAELGTATFIDTPDGLEVTVNISGLPAGKHGFHVHTESSCDASTDEAGMEVMHGAAGGHFDPNETANHAGPEVDSATGHAGDLPNLEVAEDSSGTATFVTTKMTVAEGETSLANRTIMIHANEDNYTNEPKNGGSGDRIACGVIALQ